MLGMLSLRNRVRATGRWRRVAPGLAFFALFSFAAPVAAPAETIYVSSYNVDQGNNWVHRFDSDAPSVMLESFEVDLPLPFSIEFDQSTGELYAFEQYDCLIGLCPPPAFDVARIDPFSGASSILDTSGLSQYPFRDIEADIHPVSREIRYLTGGTNARISLSTLEIQLDADLSIPAQVHAVAHAPATGGGEGIETFALASIPSGGPGSWYTLIRVGGPGGNPPASSGEVAVIGDGYLVGFVRGFDVSSNGNAYAVTFWDYDAPDGFHIDNRLYRIDLTTGAAQELGFIGLPPISSVNGISVAPPSLAPGIVAVPSLSRVALVAFLLLLASAAIRRLRIKQQE